MEWRGGEGCVGGQRCQDGAVWGVAYLYMYACMVRQTHTNKRAFLNNCWKKYCALPLVHHLHAPPPPSLSSYMSVRGCAIRTSLACSIPFIYHPIKHVLCKSPSILFNVIFLLSHGDEEQLERNSTIHAIFHNVYAVYTPRCFNFAVHTPCCTFFSYDKCFTNYLSEEEAILTPIDTS